MLCTANNCVIYKDETSDFWEHQMHGVNPKTVRRWFLPLNIQKFDPNVSVSSPHSICSSFIYNGQMKFEICLKGDFLDFSKYQHYVQYFWPHPKAVPRWK